jgi:hypothetical protein
MSMHKVPLTKLERDGLEAHHLAIGTPSQISDCFRLGVQWAVNKAQERLENELYEELCQLREENDRFGGY